MSPTSSNNVDFSTMEIKFVYPGPNATVGRSQQPFPYTFDLYNYNDLLYVNDTDEVPLPGRLTLWIDGKAVEHEDLVLPKLVNEELNVFRWKAYVPKGNPMQQLGLGNHTIGISFSGEQLETVSYKKEAVLHIVEKPQNAHVSILTPDQGQILALPNTKDSMVEVRWQLVNFLVPRDGYLRISLDGKEC